MAEPTVTTKLELELTLSMQNYADGNDYTTKKISLENPVTTAGGLSAIADFRDFLLTQNSIAAAPGLTPCAFFQPTGYPTEGTYKVVATTAEIVETTTTRTPIE